MSMCRWYPPEVPPGKPREPPPPLPHPRGLDQSWLMVSIRWEVDANSQCQCAAGTPRDLLYPLLHPRGLDQSSLMVNIRWELNAKTQV